MAAHLICTGGASSHTPEECNFQELQDQAEGQLHVLGTLSPELRNTMLGAFQELLQDRQALQELEDTVMGPLARLSKDPKSRQTTGKEQSGRNRMWCPQLAGLYLGFYTHCWEHEAGCAWTGMH